MKKTTHERQIEQKLKYTSFQKNLASKSNAQGNKSSNISLSTLLWVVVRGDEF